MHRFLRLMVVLLVVVVCHATARSVRAQAGTGAICIATFEDANRNGSQDAGEGSLAGGLFTLASDGVIVATHITTGDVATYCFQDLAPGSYTVTFVDSPAYEITTPTGGTYALESGQNLPLSPFGAARRTDAELSQAISAQAAQAGRGSGAICISTFADANLNGEQDATEQPLGGVNVNLSMSGVIVSTHLTTADEARYCFQNLLPGIYTVTFTDSPLYRATIANTITHRLQSGQELTIAPFGAAPIPPTRWRAEVDARLAASQGEDEPMELSLRLLLATVGSLVIMIFMVGVGALVFGAFGGRKRQAKSRK